MSVKFAPLHLRVPEGFQQLLEGLTREVLRDQPEELVPYCAQYFKSRLMLRDAGTGSTETTPESGRSQESNSAGSAVSIEKTGDSPARSSHASISGESNTVLSQGDSENADLESKDTDKDEQQEEVDIDLEDPEVQAAASKIQGVFRKHRKPAPKVAETSEPEPEVEQAAATDLKQDGVQIDSSASLGDERVSDVSNGGDTDICDDADSGGEENATEEDNTEEEQTQDDHEEQEEEGGEEDDNNEEEEEEEVAGGEEGQEVEEGGDNDDIVNDDAEDDTEDAPAEEDTAGQSAE